MLDCELCHTNEISPYLTRCCKVFICIPCKDRLDKKLACQCGRALQVGKKSAIESPELYQIIRRYRQGKKRQCDRCEIVASVECVNCDMFFCGNCNNQIHAAVGFSKHERSKVSNTPNLEKIRRKQNVCCLHSQVITMGCECGSGLCGTCIKSHKQQCPKGAKPKILRQFKQQYFLNVLFKMRQIDQFKQRLKDDKQKYSIHFHSQQEHFIEQKRLICQQFQYLTKLIQMKYSSTKIRLNNYWKECQKIYDSNLAKITQKIVKYDEYAELLGQFTNSMLNLDYFDKKIVRTNVNFEFVNLKTIGMEQIQSAILNVNLVQKQWENNQHDFAIDDTQQVKQLNAKEQLRYFGSIQNVSDQIIEYTNNPLKSRILSLLPSHREICFNFIHLPYQNMKYEVEYGYGMKSKGQEIFKKIININGYGTIQGLNPNTKYRIRMRVSQGQWGPIFQIYTLDIPKFNLENSLCAKAASQNSIQLVKGGAIYGSNEIYFGIHRWVIKMTSKSISYQDSETACMSLGVSNKQTKKAIFVGTTLNYGYQKTQIILKVLLDCYQKRLVIVNSATNKQDVFQNLPNFPLFPTIQNKGSGQIIIKYNLATDDPNLC